MGEGAIGWWIKNFNELKIFLWILKIFVQFIHSLVLYDNQCTVEPPIKDTLY